MTIAACYVCPEGVVLGADSTTTFEGGTIDGHPSHFNFSQKLFEVGEKASLGIVTWGRGGVGTASYRTMIAELGEQLYYIGNFEVLQAASIWSEKFWASYDNAFPTEFARVRELAAKGNAITVLEKEELMRLVNGTSVGFCIGGHGTWNRQPRAFEVSYGPLADHAPVPTEIQIGRPRFWGWSNFIERLLFGLDQNIFDKILASGKWNGTQEELVQIVRDSSVSPPGFLPIREGIDWVYSSIYSTIKGFKFSRLDSVCGGPIEVAVITTDRRFRWVCHKELDAALN